jgi:hypothetical protein
VNEEAQIPLPHDSTRLGPEMQGRVNPIFEFEPQPVDECCEFL